MGEKEQPDRLLSEKELIRLAKERFGLTASKVIQMITDCPEASAIEAKYPGEHRENTNNGSHDRGLTHKTETTP